MALDFPASPSNGQVHTSGGTSWSYDGNKWVVVAGQNIEPVYIASTTPAGVDGQIYWDSDESTAYIYYTDGDGTSQWVPLTSTGPSLFDATAITTGILPALRGGTGINDFDPKEMEADNGRLRIFDIGAGAFKPAALTYSTQQITDSALVERIRISDSGSIGLAGQNYGTDGQCLTSQGGTSSPEWRTPPLSNRNFVINGAMQVAQRATSATGLGNTDSRYHTVDRFKFGEHGTPTYEFTMAQSTDAPEGFRYSTRFDTTTAQATLVTDDSAYFETRLEGRDLGRLKYGTSNAEDITLSFYVKGSVTGTYVVWLYNPSGTDSACTQTYTIDTADTWEYKQITIAGDTALAISDTTAAGLYLRWMLAAGPNYTSGTASTTWTNASVTNANRYVGQTVNLAASTDNDWAITGVQLEVGSVATPFEHRSYADELLKCQRYCYRVNGDGVDGRVIGTGLSRSTSAIRCVVPLPVTMRATEQDITESGLNCMFRASDTTVSMTSSQNEGMNAVAVTLSADSGTPFTTGDAILLRVTSATTAFFEVESEI